ncbi:MAG: hypothetical protein JNK02_09200 [Planctomycetes bacterium]|nr:hypothetical protein [Planctomycetota bacterium]
MDMISTVISLILALPAQAAGATPTSTSGAQEGAKPAAKPVADDFLVGAGQAGAKPPKDLAALRRDLARAQLHLEVDGRPEAAREVLSAVWDELARGVPFEGRKAVVLTALELTASLLQRVGEQAALTALFAPQAEDRVRRADLEALADDPRLAALRARFLSGATPTGVGPDRIDRLVGAALENGTPGVVLELGAAAAPALERSIREDPEQLPVRDRDALVLLFQCAPQRAVALSVKLLREPRTGFLFAKRVLRALPSAPDNILHDDPPQFRFDSATSDRPPMLVETAWRDLTTELVREPLAAGDALEYVRRLAEFDALDEPLRQAVLAYANSGQPGAAARVAGTLKSRGNRASVRPLLEALLRSPRAELRVTAAGELARESHSESLLTLVDDPEPGVRIQVAAALEPRRLDVLSYTPAGASLDLGGSTVERTMRPEDRPILDRLLADRDPAVRAAALRTATSAGLRLDAAAVERFLGDGDPAVREAVIRVLPAEPDAAAPYFRRVLADAVERVRRAGRIELYARFGVVHRANGGIELLEPAPSWSPALCEIVAPGLVSLSDTDALGNARWRVMWRLLDTEADARALVGAAIAAAPDRAITDGLLNLLSSADRERAGVWSLLDAGLVEGLLRHASAVSADPEAIGWQLAQADRSPEVRAGVARVILDPALRRSFRMSLLPAVREESSLSSLVVRVLTEPAWGAAEADPWLVTTWAHALRDDVPIEALLAAVPPVLDATVPDEIVGQLIRATLRTGASGPAARSRQILARFHPLRTSTAKACVDWALRAEAEQGRWDGVRSALSDPESIARAGALGTIARLRPPQGLDWLAQLLHDPAQSRRDGATIASAIAGYLSEEAAEILLRGAELAPNADARKACLEGVAEIRAFLEQKQSWKQRTSGAQQRDAAIADLAALLDSKDPATRAEAARGLATLEGVEHLPRLVRMLQDPDEGVRKAVRAALDRLNATR